MQEMPEAFLILSIHVSEPKIQRKETHQNSSFVEAIKKLLDKEYKHANGKVVANNLLQPSLIVFS